MDLRYLVPPFFFWQKLMKQSLLNCYRKWKTPTYLQYIPFTWRYNVDLLEVKGLFRFFWNHADCSAEKQTESWMNEINLFTEDVIMQEDCSLKLVDISQHAFCISLFVMAFMLFSQYFQLLALAYFRILHPLCVWVELCNHFWPVSWKWECCVSLLGWSI